MINEGWKCPGCGVCFAPFVLKCDTCGGDQINPPGWVRLDDVVECVHIWGAPQINGTFCTICGMQQIPPPPPMTTCSSENGRHEWMGSSHGDYCADCNTLKSNTGTLDTSKPNCGI